MSSGIYFITINLTGAQPGVNPIFRGEFQVDYNATPNIIAFYEIYSTGKSPNILAPVGSWAGGISTNQTCDNLFISRSYPFNQNGTNITTMSYFSTTSSLNPYGLNNTPPPSGDMTYNLYIEGFAKNPYIAIYNFDGSVLNSQWPDNFYTFTVTGGPAYPPFPYDGSIPTANFYTIQGLPMFLNQNPQYKIYYSDVPQFPFLTVYGDTLYPNVIGYNIENVPLNPFLTFLNSSELRLYQEQLELFRKVYTHNSNAYIAFINNPGTAKGPIYYTFQSYKELNNYKAGLQLVNRLYPFDLMATAVDFLTNIPLRWIVPFPL